MGNTTRANLEKALSQAIGDYQSLSTATGAAAATTTTLVDADLADLTEDDDGIQGWVELTNGDADDDIRRIKASGGYDAASTTITPNNPFSADPNATDDIAVTYLLHRINPNLKRDAIGQAIRQLYPILYLPIRDEGIVVDNLLLNSDFQEDLSDGEFPSWTSVNSPIEQLDTALFFHGTQSGKLSGAATGQIYQTVYDNVFSASSIATVTGKTVTFLLWALTTSASVIRLQLDFDGGTTVETGSYHSGTDQWERLSVSTQIPDDATMVRAVIDAGIQASYFNLAYLSITPVYKYTLPVSIINGPHKVEEQADILNPKGRYLPIPVNGSPRSGRILRLHGMAQLTVPTTDSGTTEVDGPKVDLIVAKAMELLFKMMARQTESPEYLREQIQDAQAEQARLLRQPGVRMMALAAEMPGDNWHTEADSLGRYLVFENSRRTVG